MQKEFNITGTCRPTEHYMADVSGKLAKTLEFVERGKYFIINRPRQYGKTTMLYTLQRVLAEKYVIFNISFEGIGDAIFEQEKSFTRGFVELMANYAKYKYPQMENGLDELAKGVFDLKTLSKAISDILLLTDKKIVILIDEVDKSSNNQLFISFLAMLRNKYLERENLPTFHSIVLAGVHDIKSMKAKIRPDEEQKYNSPWNIAAEYTVDMNLYPNEIIPMLEAYASDRAVQIDVQQIANRLFYHTSGYPFLVSKLCKMFDETYLPEKLERTWTIEDVDIAARQLVKETNTNFDTQIKNLENSQELYRLIYNIALAGEKIAFNIHDPVINLASLYGLLVNKNECCAIHNQIYASLLTNHMSAKLHRIQLEKGKDFGGGYKNDDGTLNMEAVLLGFQSFMKKEYSRKDRDFLEKNGRLVFLAFLKPIINGSGYDFKEVQISEEKRLDVVITFLHQKFVAELKIWRGEKLHQQGLKQLAEYVEGQNLTEGFLLIFDHSATKNWQSEWLEAYGKKILVAWV